MTATQATRPLEDVFVIDSTVHGYNFRATLCPWALQGACRRAAHRNPVGRAHQQRAVRDQRYVLSRERFENGHDPGLLGGALFSESDTDVCIYHGVSALRRVQDGGSALWVGKAMRERWPDRVALYGPVSPGSLTRWTSSSR